VDPKKIRVLPEDEKIKKGMLSDLRKKRKGLFFYCLTDSKNGIMEIVPAWAFLLEHREDAKVYGIASTKARAFALFEQMIGEVYRETNTFDVRGYFE